MASIGDAAVAATCDDGDIALHGIGCQTWKVYVNSPLDLVYHDQLTGTVICIDALLLVMWMAGYPCQPNIQHHM